MKGFEVGLGLGGVCDVLGVWRVWECKRVFMDVVFGLCMLEEGGGF